jgi:hypothetical protein
MKKPTLEEALDLGVALQALGTQLAAGKVPEPSEVIAVLAAGIVAFADDTEELKLHLDAAARARQDFLVDLATRAQLGPRPK